MGIRADLPTPRHDADRIMLDEAMGAVSPSALAHAIGYKLVERFGGERAADHHGRNGSAHVNSNERRHLHGVNFACGLSSCVGKRMQSMYPK